MHPLILFLFAFLISIHAGAVCVSKSEVELKTKPDGKGSAWIVGRYMPLMQVSRKGAWIQVMDVDSSKHWIHARYLTDDFDYVIVRSSTANLRLGPGTQYPSTDLAVVRKYATFRKLGRDEDWIKVQDEFGQIHWLHESTVWEPRFRTKVSF